MSEAKPAVPNAIFLMGPTASGKTEIALRLAEELPCDIISVDSAMIYRGMEIGTAKPSAEELARAPHRLINILEPSETYSVANFRSDALREMAEISASGRIPLLVGGTMLYFRALQQGLSELPAADPEVRQRLEVQAEQHGWQVMHQRLADIDPVSAARIHQNDPQRLQRALEVYEITGQTMTEMTAKQKEFVLPYNVHKVGLMPSDRQWLRDRAAVRFDQMLKQGFVDEVTELRKNPDLNLTLPSMRCVGYRQVWEYLDGHFSYDEMRTKGIVATRQLAKRQITWLRSEENMPEFDPLQKGLFDRVLKSLENVTI